MNENAKLWVTALRSGEFEQTQRLLHDATGYCCLGVACELYRRETGLGEWEEYPTRYNFVHEGERVYSVLPVEVCEWLGLNGGDGSYTTADDEYGDGLEASLSTDNDTGVSFSGIADTIESQPKGLFFVSAQLRVYMTTFTEVEDGELVDPDTTEAVVSCDPDGFDREDGLTAVDIATRWLADEYVTQFSVCPVPDSGSMQHDWWSYVDGSYVSDHYTGERTEVSAHPEGFTDDEIRAICAKLRERTR